MKKYILIAKEIKTYVDEFNTREEAEEAMNNLEKDDLKTNVNLTYEIVLSEDHEANLLQQYNISKTEDGSYLGQRDDLRNFLKELTN